VRVAESNRQQCFFPEGAEVFTNRAGTADGFRCAKDGLDIYVLPGPPRELAAIWEDHLDALLRRDFPGQRSLKPRIWKCMGKSEAELGEIVEEALKGTGFLTGYRAHMPYIEVKVWAPEGAGENGAFQKLEQAIAPWLVSRDDEDVAQEFLKKALADNRSGSRSGELVDGATGGVLAERIASELRRQGKEFLIRTFWGVPSLRSSAEVEAWVNEQFKQPSVIYVLGGYTSDGRALAAMKDSGQKIRMHWIDSPYKATSVIDRMHLYTAESALRFWRES
jgi:hypothetical protein